MDYEEYKRKALDPIVNYIESVMASYSKEELEARIKKALPNKESEDERIRKEIMEYLTITREKDLVAHPERQRWIAYLEKQKEQKPAEWSEDDEILAHLLLRELERDKEDSPEYSKHFARLIDWFNARFQFLRPQLHWKPSEEQMCALQVVIEHGLAVPNREASLAEGHIESLYRDLEKLL